jgi:response regulator of citrate/malate metabolism
MKVLLATGIADLDHAITERLPSFDFVGFALYKEAVIDCIERKNPEHIVMSELLEGVVSFEELLPTIRQRFPALHIVFIRANDDTAFDVFLEKNDIHDVLQGKFTPSELEIKLTNVAL